VTSRIIGYKPQRLRDAQFRHFMLQDLESDQIQDFIYRWHELTFTDEADKARKRERFQQAINTSSAIGELAGNPLLLTMMAILNRNQELPRDRPELYNQASRLLLHQWDVEQKLLENPRVDSVAIDYKDKQAMLRQIAYHMQAADQGLAGNLIRGEDLEKILTSYLKSIEVSQARTVARLLIEQLRSRNFILCFMGADSYAFVHRTFLEYFCACEFVERFGKRGLEGGLTLEELKTEVFGKHWQDESWHEVVRLIVGMIDTSFAGQIIDYLMVVDGETGKFINLLLAAECLSEVRNQFEIAETATKLLNYLKHISLGRYKGLNGGIYYRIISVIATIWKEDIETLPWLKACTQFTENWLVQRTAIYCLAQGWKDDLDTLPIIKTCVQSDDYWAVRCTVVQILAEGWKDELDTLPFLKSCALSDDNGYVRGRAVRELARGWKDEPWMFDFLCDRALNDPFERKEDREDNPRQLALEIIIKQYPDHPQTLPLCKDRAENDLDEQVREFAKTKLAELEKDN
jgi:predicted NACHT family NTPase